MLSTLLSVALPLAICAGQAGAPPSSSRPAQEIAVDPPSTRFDSVVSACSASGAEATTRALENERDAVRWILRVRLGLASSLAEWSPCVQAATASVLRSRASLARDELVAQLFDAPEPLPFRRAMGLLAELGDERDLAMLLDWAELLDALEPGDEHSSEGAIALRESCATLASHSATDRFIWAKSIERASEAMRMALARGLADCGSKDALERLSNELGRGRVGENLLLMEIARAARRIDRMHDAEVRRVVRSRLDGDEGLRRDAALCAGALGDEASAERLVQLLADPSEGVRANAHWALQHLTGRRLPPAPQAWSRWLAAEIHWWNEEAPTQLRQLASPEAQTRVAAARNLASHRFPRHSLAAELADAVPFDDAGAAAIVLSALEHLNSHSAFAPLERRSSEARNPAVHGAVDRLLAALAKRALPQPASTPASH